MLNILAAAAAAGAALLAVDCGRRCSVEMAATDGAAKLSTVERVVKSKSSCLLLYLDDVSWLSLRRSLYALTRPSNVTSRPIFHLRHFVVLVPLSRLTVSR